MHVTELTEKQLRNMDTKRLIEVRKVLNKAISKLTQEIENSNEAGECHKADVIRMRVVRTQHTLIKEILSEREHIETKKVKTPRRENKRDRVYD